MISQSRATLYVKTFLAAMPTTTTLLHDDHLVFAVLLLAMACLSAGDDLGAGKAWKRAIGGRRVLL